MKLTASFVGNICFLLVLASLIAFAGNLPFMPTLLSVGFVSLFIPSDKNSLAMNGIVARENFNIASKIFNNAFNPKMVVNSAGQLVPNGAYKANWDAAIAFRLCQSDLILEQPIIQGGAPTSVYQFPVLNNIQNQGAQFNTELRLTMQDSFVPTEVGIFLGNPSGLTDTTWKPITWASPFTFVNGPAMQAIYNGALQVQINNVNYITNWSLWRHWVTTQTQQTAVFGPGSPVDQMNGSDDGYYPMQPFVLLLGSSNINITIKLPLAATAADANSRIRIQLRGVLAQNSTVVN